jgi:Zn-dependent oligopeptidase
MPFLDENGVQRFWENSKAYFPHKIDKETSRDSNTIKLIAAKTSYESGTRTINEFDLGTITLNKASQTEAGLMSADDKKTLDKVNNIDIISNEDIDSLIDSVFN